MKRLAIAAIFAIAGCAPAVQTYEPYVGDIVNPSTLVLDKAGCRAYALAYRTPLDLEAIATGAAQGAAKNASGAAINPLVPALGAVGGATSSALSGLGILNDDQRRVFLKCLEHRGLRSGAYNVMDPNF